MSYHVIDRVGNIIGWVATEDEALDLLAQVPEDIYTFFVGGSDADVQRFMLQLNGLLGVTPTFFDSMAERYGVVPDTINPMQEIQAEFFKHSTFFIKLRASFEPRVAAQLLSVLRRTVPAGSGFFVLLEPTVLEEAIDLSTMIEDVAVFYDVDTEDTLSDVTEHVLPSTIL